MLKDDEVNRYLIGIFKQMSVSVGKSYASGVLHAYSFLGNRYSWSDVNKKADEIADKYFDTLMQTGKGYGDMDLSDRYASISDGIKAFKRSESVWKFLQGVASDFKDKTEEQAVLAYRKGMLNTYIEHGIEYVRLNCGNEWCQSYEKHKDKIFKIGTQPELPLIYCQADYRPYKPAVTDMLNAEKVKNFTKKESDIMAETEKKIQKILDEAEQAVLRIMKLK